MAYERRRRGLIRLLGTVVDETKDYVDDVLDRARDVNDDLRSSTRRLIDSDDDHRYERRSTRHDDGWDRDDRDDDQIAATEIRRLQASLVTLTDKVNQLAVLQQSESTQPPEKQRKSTASQ
jgi:hypothetical protein